LNVAENVGLYLSEHRLKPPAEIGRIVSEKLAAVGLSDVEGKYPGELSGGMKKRVAIARALVVEPQLMLYDEPTSELDPVMSATITEIIATLKEQYHVTSIVVTHDRDLALGIADRVGILMGGRLISLGPPSALHHPSDARVADFLNPQIDLKNPRFRQLEN
jgi:phospholipid/cholesterol/gamma-HCH transport system ATP-binding protein